MMSYPFNQRPPVASSAGMGMDNSDIRGISNTLQLLSESVRGILSRNESQIRNHTQAQVQLQLPHHHPHPVQTINVNVPAIAISPPILNGGGGGMTLTLEDVMKEMEKLTESQNMKLNGMEEKIEEGKTKVTCLEGELRLCWDELEGERRKREEAELRLEEGNKKFDKEIGELKDKNRWLEERITSLETRSLASPTPAPPPPEPVASTSTTTEVDGGSEEVMTLLNKLYEETGQMFTEWNGRQLGLQEEFARLKGIVDNLASANDNIGGGAGGQADLQQDEPPTSPTSSPVVDMDVSFPFQVKIEPGVIGQEGEDEDDPPFVVVTSNSLAALLPPGPVSPSILDDDHAPEDPEAPPPDNNPDENEQVQGQEDESPPPPPPEDPNPIDTLIHELIPDIQSQANQATPKISKRMESWMKEHGLESSKDWTCLCGNIFTSESSLKEHIGCYTKSYKFACPICFDEIFNCPKRFRRLHVLKAHLMTIHSAQLDSYQAVGCRECGSMTSSLAAFKQHLNKCPQERVSSSDNPDQDNPREPIIHGEAPQVILEPYQVFLCYCGHQVGSNEELLQHIAEFTRDLKVPCGGRDCGELFRNEDDREKHMHLVHRQNSIRSLFQKQAAAPPRQRLNENAAEEPTSYTEAPDAPPPLLPNPTLPSSLPQSPQGQVSNGRKRPASKGNRSLSVGSPSLPSQGTSSSSSLTPKRPRLDYPGRRASLNMMKGSGPGPGTGPSSPSPPISHEPIHE